MSGCARKEIIGMIVIIASRNVDRKIMQCVRIMSGLPARMWNGSTSSYAHLPK